jgi:hypothetical protein
MNTQELALNFLRENPTPFQWLLLLTSAAMGTCTPEQHQTAIGVAELLSKPLNSPRPQL